MFLLNTNVNNIATTVITITHCVTMPMPNISKNESDNVVISLCNALANNKNKINTIMVEIIVIGFFIT